jgi:1,4-alpha-glucan branching enzyme
MTTPDPANSPADGKRLETVATGGHRSRPDPRLTDLDLHLFNEGKHRRLYDKLGAHPTTEDGHEGTRFAVWAPDAESVNVMGDFNGWNGVRHGLRPIGSSGVWQGFFPDVRPGHLYKYDVRSRYGAHRAEKADPFGFAHEFRPRTASIVTDFDHRWEDGAWMAGRARHNAMDAPMSIYEVHLGSFARDVERDNGFLDYRRLARLLGDRAERLGFTHVELLPVSEHPFDGSWGYQVTGYFAPTSRFGSPEDFAWFVDHLHQRGIGVILDWVPAHFPTDGHGLGYFDGTHLFEHADARRGFHPDWKSFIFNYDRHEVRAFLISSACFWFDWYHIDGLRVDGVASMLYLDYSRNEGEWIPNEHGGRENLGAIQLLRETNEAVFGDYPDTQTFAEESTSWPMVSRPTYIGGLGFGFKWDLGWMHDTLSYFQRESVHRCFHHNDLTFRSLYAFQENFVLPLSHDEVVHGKGSLIGKMPGDEWQKFANLRLLYSYMWAQAGKKLLFMGGEIAQWAEWNHDRSLDWHLLDHEPHRGIERTVADLNRVYRGEPALHTTDVDPVGFEWVDANDAQQSVLTFLRRGRAADQVVAVALNFTPVPRYDYRVGVPFGGYWQELFNSDAELYGGSGVGNAGGVEASPVGAHGRPYALHLTLPPLGAVFLRGPTG